MSNEDIQKIADNADMILAGYAFTKTKDGFIRILNLQNTDEACVLQQDGTMIETTMNDINLLKVQSYYLKNLDFMEVEIA